MVGVSPEYVVYESGELLLEREQRVDIAFLDVEMPGINGIQTGVELKKHNPYVKIFVVTAYPDYLDDAMRTHVFRYLSKPIDQERLRRNLRDAILAYHTEPHTVLIETSDGVFPCLADEIVYVETEQRKVRVHTVHGDFLSGNSMEYWCRTLAFPCFFLTHRSFLINMRYIFSIRWNEVLLRFANRQAAVNLSRRRYAQLHDNYLAYMENET